MIATEGSDHEIKKTHGIYALVLMVIILVSAPPVFCANIFDYGEIEVKVNVEPYGVMDIIGEDLFVDDLEGEAGLYISDGRQVKSYALGLWDLKDADIVNHEGPRYGIIFQLYSNCDLKVEIAYDNNEWEPKLNSPNAFLIFEHWSPYDHLGTINGNHPEGENQDNVTFTHPANSEQNEYKIGGALYIENIGQQEAGTYSNTITITISQDSEENDN